MAFTGSAPNKTYQRTDGVRTGTAVNVTAKAALVNNTAALADTRENDIADAINLLLMRDGGNQPSADLPMNTFKHTGVGAATARTHYARASQVQDGSLVYAEASGTANAIVLTTSPVCTAAEGMVIGFVAEADNTDATTVKLNDDSALALQVGGSACAGGEVNNGQFHQVGFDGTQWQLLNPHGASIFQPLDSGLTDIAGLAVTDGNIIVGDGSNWVAESGATARASLGLTIGTHVQAYDAQLDSLSAASANGVSLVTAADYAAMRGLLDLEVGTDVAAATVGQGTHTIVVPAGAMISATTSGAASGTVETSTNDINFKVFDFDDASDEYAHFNIAMPKSWNEGTVTFRVFWTTSASDTDGVAWGLQGVAVGDNEGIDASWGDPVVVTDDAQSAALEILVTSTSDPVTIGGTPAEGDIVFFRVFRNTSDENDDMTEDARLIAVQIFFTTNAATDA